MKKLLLLVAAMSIIGACPRPALAVAADPVVDIVVYGATAGGLVASIPARSMGASVIVVEASDHVGGMTTGGLSSSDVGNAESIRGLAGDFYARVGRVYGARDRVFHFEPHVAAKVFRKWLAERGIDVVTGEPLDLEKGVTKTGSRIDSITSISGRRFRRIGRPMALRQASAERCGS
jgi:NADPH-dependent 2,4-dienoyl-CoA reductase/sulfur reductase-like enzyme